MTSNARIPRLRMFCSKCGAKARAACDCGVGYVPAHAAATLALAEHPDWSDRAIAKKTGIAHATIQRARKTSTGSNEPVEKRIGLDGKSRCLPRHSNPYHPRSETELEHVPKAVRLVVNLMPMLRELRQESKCYETDIDLRRVHILAHQILNQIFEYAPPIYKANICENCAQGWKVDGTKLNKDDIDAVRKAAHAWSDLLKRYEAAAEPVATKGTAESEQQAAAQEECPC